LAELEVRHALLDGTSRQERRDLAERRSEVVLDDQDLPSLIVRAVDHAAMVKFFDADGTVPGGWGAYFEGHELVVMARILVLDPGLLEEGFSRDWRLRRSRVALCEVEVLQFGEMTDSVLGLAQRMDLWGLRLRRGVSSPAGQALLDYLERLQLGLGMAVGILRRHCGDLLETVLSPQFLSLARDDGGKDMATAFHILLEAFLMLQAKARVLWPLALQGRSHDPSVGLLVTFAGILGKVRGRVDAFARHRQGFYYREVLGGRPQPFQPDRACLVLEALGDADVLIPAGTQFVAGTDPKGRELVFASLREVWVGPARVEHLMSLAFPREKGHRQARACWFGTMKTETRLARPMMGVSRDGSRPETAAAARLGFAVAHPILRLKEGVRRVTVRLEFADVPLWERRLEEMSRDSGSGVDDQVRVRDGFLKLFRRMFRISLTTVQGWSLVEEYFPRHEAGRLILSFALGVGFPEVRGCDPALHGTELETLLPVARFELSGDQSQYGYDQLKGLDLTGIGLDVQVEGCRDLVVHNQIARLSTLAPFQPFGPLPEVGSYLVVGCAEAAVKNLNSFTVALEWGGLPSTPSLEAWYAGYKNVPSLRDFQLDVSVLADGQWASSGVSGRLSLFRPAERPGAPLGIHPVSRIGCANVVAMAHPAVGESLGEVFDFVPTSRNGFFRFTLAGPEGAFGHQEHPALLSSTLMHNARHKIERLHRPLPQPPITPKVTSILADYAASSVLRPGDDEGAFFHLHPTGWQRQGQGECVRMPLFPSFDFQACLMVGIQARAISDTITLCFRLDHDSEPSLRHEHSRPKWSFLESQGWEPLEEKAVLRDSTEGFMTSGIVTLRLPKDWSCDHPLMPKGLYWLRIESSDPRPLASLFGVHAQAVEVVWNPVDSAQERDQAILPEGTITGLRRAIAGIGAVRQIGPTCGGKLREEDLDWRTRSAERLRHKGRALSVQDCEELVLQEFPEIGKVKAFPGLSLLHPDQRQPGRILVVPLPSRAEIDGVPARLTGMQIREIEEFLRDRASTFASIEVANPGYDEVTVRCTIRLDEDHHGERREEKLVRGLREFLFPWCPGGNECHFGWHLRQRDVETFLRSFAFVQDVQSFSFLRVSREGKGRHSLLDTARQSFTAGASLHPRHPWSLIHPAVRQCLRFENADPSLGPLAVGLGDLIIGSTFIVSSTEDAWEKRTASS
jgi:hypothetical protein